MSTGFRNFIFCHEVGFNRGFFFYQSRDFFFRSRDFHHQFFFPCAFLQVFIVTNIFFLGNVYYFVSWLSVISVGISCMHISYWICT
jgi:hypothetical protein